MTMVAVIVSGCSISGVPVHSEAPSGEISSIKRIRISALTEFVPDPASGQVQIKAFVEFIDAFDSSVKNACVLRFELYEFHPLSSDPRGRRLLIWPEQNLDDPETNDTHWKDFLRGYEFYLPLEFVPQPEQKYVLEASCQLGQQRYNELFKMQYQP